MRWRTPIVTASINEAKAEVIKARVSAFRGHVLNTAKITVSNIWNQFQDDIKDGDSTVLKMGYADRELWPVFTGSVLKADNQETIDLACQCLNRQLFDTRITRTYQNAVASDVITHLLGDLEYTSQNISSLNSIIDKLPMADQTIQQGLYDLKQRLRFDHQYYTDASGNFFFNTEDELSTDVTAIETDQVFDFKSSMSGFTMLCAGMNVWHSELVSYKNNEYLVMGVEHSTGFYKQGFVSKLWLKGV